MVYRRGFVTRHQVTGWRFVMRRIASGVALHDTRMLVDPLRTQTRAVLMGVLMVITALVGCFVFSLIRPNGSAANNPVLADRSTAALYVKVGDQLHPVLNLASARLIVGRPVNPATVKSSELDKFPRGNLIGIPGAPERMVQNTSKDADWTVCDSIAGSGRRGDGDRRSPRQHWHPGRAAGRGTRGAGPQRHQHLAAVGRSAQPDRPRRPRRYRRAGLGQRHTCAAAHRRRPVQRDPRGSAAVRAGHPGRRQPRAVRPAGAGTGRRGG